MQIWTNTQLNNLLLEKEYPVKIIPEEILKDSFLSGALAGDIALVYIDEEYMDFLASVKAKGINSPVILISPEPTIMQENLFLYNAIILDLKKTGTAEVKKIVNFFIKNALERVASAFSVVPDKALAAEAAKTAEEESDVVGPIIVDVLKYSFKEKAPVTISFKIAEESEKVTIRGICKIKSISNDAMVLNQFKPLVLPKGFSENLEIKLAFSYKNKNYSAAVNVKKVLDEEIMIPIPESLHVEKIKHIRLQPSSKKPVYIFLLLPNEPTIQLKAVDISQQDFNFVSTRNLSLNTVYSFTIVLPDPRKVIVSYCVIRMKQEAGANFLYNAELRLHPKDEEGLSQYIMKRESEIVEFLGNS